MLSVRRMSPCPRATKASSPPSLTLTLHNTHPVMQPRSQLSEHNKTPAEPVLRLQNADEAGLIAHRCPCCTALKELLEQLLLED